MSQTLSADGSILVNFENRIVIGFSMTVFGKRQVENRAKIRKTLNSPGLRSWIFPFVLG